MKNNNIYVTMPTLASLSDVNALLEGVWERGVMTHNGPLVQRFEKEVAEFLNLKNVVTVTNGTIAIQMAIKALGLKGKLSLLLLHLLQPLVPLYGRVYPSFCRY